jgi:lipopolysaccharide/colanic/teichoic acid biosynthesis glycosyltransferase
VRRQNKVTGQIIHLRGFQRRATLWDVWQRRLDVILIAVSSPLWVSMLLFLLGLKLLLDGRPVMFEHLRLGRNGKRFLLHKIRTTPHTFEARSDDWSTREFPPRTLFGRYLRRFDLDELPQLWNVLKGDMSLVGPRPEMPLHTENFDQQFPFYRSRLVVRPGITGLAQIRGWRGNTSIKERLRCDLEYIAARGPAVYLYVLARTVWVVLRGRSAPAYSGTFADSENVSSGRMPRHSATSSL